MTATSNPVWVREDASRRVYWGETHGHCGFGEGQGTPTAFFEFGRDDSRLDFLTITEHDALTDDGEWRKLDQLVRRVQRRREVRHFPRLRVVGAAAAGRPSQRDLPPPRAPSHRAPGVSRCCRCSTRGCAPRTTSTTCSSFRTPTTPATGRATIPKLEKLVEVSSLHGTFEWFGNLYLKSGFEVGFVGGSDDHRTNPGMPLALPRPFMTQRSGIGARVGEREDAPTRSSTRSRASRPMPPPASGSSSTPRSTGTRWGRASPTRRGGGSKRRSRAPARSITSTWSRTGRWRSAATISAAALEPQVDDPGRVRVVVRGLLPARSRQPAAAAGVDGDARGHGRAPARRRVPGFDNAYSEFARRDPNEPEPRRVPHPDARPHGHAAARARRRRAADRGPLPSRADDGDRIEGGQRPRANEEMPAADFELRLERSRRRPDRASVPGRPAHRSHRDPGDRSRGAARSELRVHRPHRGGAWRLLLCPRHAARRQPGVLEPVLGGRLRPPAGHAVADHRPARRKRARSRAVD